MPLADAIEATLVVAEALEELKVQYLVGGSLASSLHGIPRATNDADIVADLKLEFVAPFVEALDGDFHVDQDVIREAVRRRGSFNLIHLASMFKLDVFVLSDDPAQRREMKRRRSYIVDQESGRTLSVATAEDIILMKLRWYLLGEEVSERQWQDVQGVMKVQGEKLDFEYLLQGAEQMGLSELYRRAIDEAGIVTPPTVPVH